MSGYLKRRLDSLLEQTSLSVSAEQRDKLVGYVLLLHKWNRVYNLTAVREPHDMLTRHVMDSIIIAQDMGAMGQRFVDAGTGPGLPGIPLAIVRPDKEFHLLDSSSKRIHFVRQAVHELEIPNTNIFHNRIEAHRPKERYDGVISRALAPIVKMLNLCRYLVKSGSGTFLALRGKVLKNEIHSLPPWCQLEQIRPLVIPGLENEERHLVIFSRAH